MKYGKSSKSGTVEEGVNLGNYGICQDILKRAISKRPTCQKLAFRDKLSFR